MDNESYEVQLSELSESIDESIGIGNYNEVIKLCNRFLILKPNDKLAYLNKGLAYWKIVKYNESILFYNELYIKIVITLKRIWIGRFIYIYKFVL